MKKVLTIMIPAYNEQEVLPHLFERLNQVTTTLTNYEVELLFINDGSRDETLPILYRQAQEQPNISIVDLSRNYGKEVAMLAGFDYVQGDAVIIIDADLQDPPELIPEMVQYWEQGYDDVYAERRSREGETWLKKWTSKTYYRLLAKLSNVPVQKDTGDFRLLDRKCIEAIRQLRESQRYTKGMFSWIGFKKKEILFDRDPRVAGETKWNYLKLFDLAIDGLTSSTVAPLRLSSVIGFVFSICAFLYLFFVILKTLLFGEPVQGYPSLMAVILFLGGIQLLSLGIIGEYIGKIFYETKNRPVYFTQQVVQAKLKNHQ